MDFEQESEIMDMKGEMMDDTMEDALGEDDEEEESDAIVNQVLDEIGISLDGELVQAPTGKLGSSSGGVKEKQEEPMMMEASGGGDGGVGDDDLQRRLDSLRK